MLTRRPVVVAFVLVSLGLAAATMEASAVHSDDGCAVESHCNACLLRLGAPGVPAAAFSLPRVAVLAARVAPALPPSHEDATPRKVSSRGPPQA
jgi:hypothetical protein